MIRSNLAALVPVRTRCASPLRRVVPTDRLTLTPGARVMGLNDATLIVHVLDLAMTDIDANTAAVSGAFEPAPEAAFG